MEETQKYDDLRGATSCLEFAISQRAGWYCLPAIPPLAIG